MATSETTQKLIETISTQYGEDACHKMVSFMDMILEKNEHINLTAIRDRDEAMQKHIADSLSAAALEEFKNAAYIVDMGTGAGFPGVPLAIASQDKSFVLADSLNKRLRIIDELTDSLGIDNVRTLHTRAEDMGQNPEYREKFDLCVSRAVASLDVLAEWCLPLVKPGGYFIAYKGDNVSRETSEGSKAVTALGGKIVDTRAIETEEPEISGHSLLVIKKVKNTPARYPRPNGTARKNPIK